MVTRLQETHEEAIARLAQRARESGVKVLRDRRDGRYYASSASTVGLFHYVTAVSCDCAGFATHGRCMHHSALLVALGWTDGAPEPTSEPEPIRAQVGRCESCNGVGTHPGTISTGRVWTYANVTCEACHGCGQAEAPRAA